MQKRRFAERVPRIGILAYVHKLYRCILVAGASFERYDLANRLPTSRIAICHSDSCTIVAT